MKLKGWYALHDGWKSKLIVHTRAHEEAKVKITFYKGESEEEVHKVYIRLPPKDFKFVNLSKYRKIKNLFGIIIVESELPLMAEMYLEDKEVKLLDYGLRSIDEEECESC
ncbi:MAG: hypothetical protein QXX95_02780 [Nitrososphaerales archaeon]